MNGRYPDFLTSTRCLPAGTCTIGVRTFRQAGRARAVQARVARFPHRPAVAPSSRAVEDCTCVFCFLGLHAQKHFRPIVVDRDVRSFPGSCRAGIPSHSLREIARHVRQRDFLAALGVAGFRACVRTALGRFAGPRAALRSAGAASILSGANCSEPATNLISRRFMTTSFPVRGCGRGSFERQFRCRRELP
jgi:hypothetical protein